MKKKSRVYYNHHFKFWHGEFVLTNHSRSIACFQNWKDALEYALTSDK